MGRMTFNFPANSPIPVTQELERASITGGPDGMPTRSVVHLEPSRLLVNRDAEESGCLVTPWPVEQAGHLMLQTATLVERREPYQLQLELARGKINQVRNQASDWLMGGLELPPKVEAMIKKATKAFTNAVVRGPTDDGSKIAGEALMLACQAADQLVHVYTNQVFHFRQQRQPQLDALLGCQLMTTRPTGSGEKALLESCNSVSIPFSISDIAPAEGDYLWEASDELLDWAIENDLVVWGGPLVDFSSSNIPSWLWLWERDRARLAKVLCEYVADVIERYQDRVDTWQLSTAGNLASVLRLSDDEMLWLTLQMGEIAKRVAPDAKLVIGISQPWGDYLPSQDYMYTPFVYADTLLRSGLSVSSIELEIVMGVQPRGSYCRDLLDLSRILDLYALLGVPLSVRIGYPCSADEDETADSEMVVGAGSWRGGYDAATQKQWATEIGGLILCKPYVQSMRWVQFSDAQPHFFPHCGLLDQSGEPRPVFQSLQQLRAAHLK